jgi:predicted helicase
MELHINYETVTPYNVTRLDIPLKDNQKTPKAKLKADKTKNSIILDDVTILENIPKIAWEYMLGNRCAVEWILDQYKEISNVTNDIFLKYSHHLDEIVYEKSIALHTKTNYNLSKKMHKPNCTNEKIDGRWVLIPEGQDCPPEYCVGSSNSINWLNDKYNFNVEDTYEKLKQKIRESSAYY